MEQRVSNVGRAAQIPAAESVTCRFLACFLCDSNSVVEGDNRGSSHHSCYEKDYFKTLSRTSSVTNNDTLYNDFGINEFEIDMSHFSSCNKVIGIGGFGIVRTAVKRTGRDKGRSFAVKTISKSAVLLRNSGLSTVTSELLVLTKLTGCENICKLHYAFQDDVFLYMVFDLASGGDMRHYLRNSNKCRFHEETCRVFLHQIAGAIEFCHQRNILHRDVKPENIVMTEKGTLKLTDFGVAKLLEHVDDCRSTSGTHGYMAPEIYQQSHIHGRSADWFSLGIALHEFLTGRRPFEIQRLQAFRNFGHHDDLQLQFLEKIAEISGCCKDFMSQILHPNCNFRLGSKRGFLDFMDHPWFKDFSSKDSKIDIKVIKFDRNFMAEEDSRNAISKHLSSLPVDPSQQYLFSSYFFNNKFFDKWRQISCSVDKSPPADYEENVLSLTQMPKIMRSSSSNITNEYLTMNQGNMNRTVSVVTPGVTPNRQSANGLNEVVMESI